MAVKNNVMIVRHRLMNELLQLWEQRTLVENIDHLPIKLSPKGSRHQGRCCIHKERAVWKYKTLPLLGLDMSDEFSEVIPLSYYAHKALERSTNGKPKDQIMCVIDEACSSCIQINYEVTSLCRGCIARSCQTNCPKGAVHTRGADSTAWIDHDACTSCGICYRSCPYHAIVYIPVPCEEVCPVNAIHKDANGIERIDESKCIYCGKCMNACPFGAIFEISHVFDVLQKIRLEEEVVAIVAPSILGQFDAPIDKVYGAIKQIGFTDVIEVAQGAMDTVSNEAHELLEKIEEGQPFMTTSCCPSYVELVEKHIPDMKKYVSTTGSPMYYTARIAKQKYPNAKIVFVGPCVAKRKEAQRDEAVDYVLTFEEIASIIEGLSIDIEQSEPYKMSFTAVREAHGFAQSGGVSGAVNAFLKSAAVGALQVADLNKKSIALLRSYAKSGKSPEKFIEVMACEGGCITGPSANDTNAIMKRRLTKDLSLRKESYANDKGVD
ncbi:MAG: monomeric [FeFe] hydrogenase [Rikenellaceae bacterium]